MHLISRQADRFRVAIRHFDPDDGSIRLTEAHQTKGLMSGPPTLLGGDLNNAAGGLHVDMDWAKASERLRQTKAKLLPDDTYAADTDVMDLMLGDWDPDTRSRTKHVRTLARAAIGWHP